MKLKSGFLLRNMMGMGVVVPVTADLQMEGVITLNKTGTLLWQTMEQGETTLDLLVQTLTEAYEVDQETAARDVAVFVEKVREAGLLAE